MLNDFMNFPLQCMDNLSQLIW